MRKQRTTELHEDIEDLLKFGATFEEIVQRGGYATYKLMKASLRKRDRHDLIEKLEQRRGEIPNRTTRPRGIPPTKKAGQHRARHEWAHELPKGLEFDWSGYSLQTPA
jgi:hypothetical protein